MLISYGRIVDERIEEVIGDISLIELLGHSRMINCSRGENKAGRFNELARLIIDE